MVHASKVLAVAGTAAILLAGCGEPDLRYVSFAECLTQKNIAMYGAYWCPRCAEQKQLFADAWDKVKYVECDPRGRDATPELCKEKKITGYPTWELADGSMLKGVRPLEELSEKTQCALPAEPAEPAN